MSNKVIMCWVIVALLLSQTVTASSLGNHNKKFTPSSKMSKSDWSDVNEMKRAWDAAIVRIPETNGSYSSYIMSDMTEQSSKALKSFPTIIYLHGCSGVWQGTYNRINFLANAGFVVIAPVSFARAKYPQSCDPDTVKSSMYRGTINMRKYDAEYAISHAKLLNWVDGNNIFLMGFSQGGVTTATFKSKHDATSVNARVIEGWTCHAGWGEYKGINASANEPVLSLVGENDPWFQNSWSLGDCGSYMNKDNGSRSIVLTKSALRSRHSLLEDKDLQKTVLEFLRSHMR
jgi:dienelactone hydrolase|tara:strand:- start:82 stop:945 length:864 start_codon:yes stop_codon:yes gene_type:complete